MLGTAVAEMGEDELLTLASERAETIRQARADLLVVAYQWAVIHDPERLDPAESALPGREKSRRFGGAGTPEVCEFAAAELGARIGLSPFSAGRLMADALDLHHRLPRLWARVEAGEVRDSYARHVAAKTRDLSLEEAGFVDAGVAESADGRISWSRFEALVEAKVAQAAPALAREKEERAAQARFAKKLRGEAHGMASYLVRADIATIEAIDAAVQTRAGRLTESMPEATEDERRVHAFLLLVTGAPDEADLPVLLPTVQLYLHHYTGPDAGPITRVEGHGPVTQEWVATVLGPNCRFKVTPVLDLAGQAPVDAYEIPDRHREAVHLMTPADIFPFASSLSRSTQVDHTVPHDQGGVSGVGNYGPMTLTHHRIKTHGRWQLQQPFPGVYVFRDPHGGFYLVDHTGTRRLPATPGTPGTRPQPQVMEIYRQMPTIELDAA